MADGFTRNRLNWIERIATDSTLKGDAVRLGVILATKFLNRRTGECWPAFATPSELMAVDEKTIRRATSSLVSAGHLACKRGGKGKPNRYKIRLFDRTKLPDQGPPSPDKIVHSSESMTGQFCPDDRTILSNTEGQNCPPNPLKREPIEEPFEYISEAAPSFDDRKGDAEGFDEFYAQYPRKVARGAARKAYEKARKKVDHSILMAAVLRYSAERDG